jgi:hypothetical protein
MTRDRSKRRDKICKRGKRRKEGTEKEDSKSSQKIGDLKIL